MGEGENRVNGKMIMEFPAGSLILQEKEVNLDMYKILKGHVEIYTGYRTDNEVIIGIIGPGSCFGEFGLLLQKPAIYTVIAFDDVYAIRVTEGQMGDFVQENHSSIIQIMKNMANTMLAMQYQISQLSSELNELKKGSFDEKQNQKDLLRTYSIYNPKNPHISMTGKMHFLGRDRQ